MSSTNTFLGFDKFIWFQGVVEDRLDPRKLGRVRVRILGLHTENKNLIPTEELPWAYPISPITSAAMNGIGETPIGPVEGTWVIGFFRDGENCQEPVIFGTLTGIPQEYPYPKNKTTGLLDPLQDLSKRPRKISKKEYPNDGNGAILESEIPTPQTGESYPRLSHPLGSVIKESDINRLANKEKIRDTIVEIKKKQRDLFIPIADGTVWNEPETPYNSYYPYNHVMESESGHISEIDDTPGVERLHNYHRSGTFTEIYPDGIKVEKIVGNNYKIVLEEQYEHIQNRYNLTIDGPFNVIVQNNATIIVKGNADISVGGNLTTEVGGNYKLSVKGSVDVRSGGKISLTSNESIELGANGPISFKGSVVTSNPSIDSSLQSVISGSVVPGLKPNPPLPQSTTVPNPPDDVSIRDYPKEIPEYIPLVS
jgi:hypothetical protein